jgi:hypothetical protein
MFILKSLYGDNGNLMEGFETGRPLYSTMIDIFLICLEGYKLKEYAALWVEGVGKSFITDSVLGTT